MPSAAVVIGALRVNYDVSFACLSAYFRIISQSHTFIGGEETSFKMWSETALKTAVNFISCSSLKLP